MSIRIDLGEGGLNPHLLCSPRLQPAIQLLLEASSYAADLDLSAEVFSIDPTTLSQLGVFSIDLLWLNKRGLVAQNPTGGAYLTGAGIRYFTFETQTPTPPTISDVAQPTWHMQRRELLWGQLLIKRFRTPAPNQELILVAFEEEGWPDRIDDPLPRIATLEPKRRLHDTITTLNRHQKSAKIHFAGDGTGTGIRWERS